MLARRTTLRLRSGAEIQLPLLVPAFSSKGFASHRTGNGSNRRRYSEVSFELFEFGKNPNKAVLVSAYDVHHGLLRAPKTSTTQQDAYLAKTSVVFLDSGGYELAPDFDSTEPRSYPHDTQPFSIEDYEGVLTRLSRKVPPPPLVIANYDHGLRGQPVRDQARAARAMFARFPMFATDFILKPWRGNGRFIDPDDLSPNDLAELRDFDIVGVAEKDLSQTLMQRLTRLAALRRRLDDAGIDAPIHVWGGLEPVATPLMFFAGAEIFDGISWLRYAFKNGFAIVRESYCVVSEAGLTASHEVNHHFASMNNLRSLEQLEIAMQQWIDLDGLDFTVFHESVREDLKKAYHAMVTRIGDLGGIK